MACLTFTLYKIHIVFLNPETFLVFQNEEQILDKASKTHKERIMVGIRVL